MSVERVLVIAVNQPQLGQEAVSRPWAEDDANLWVQRALLAQVGETRFLVDPPTADVVGAIAALRAAMKGTTDARTVVVYVGPVRRGDATPVFPDGPLDLREALRGAPGFDVVIDSASDYERSGSDPVLFDPVEQDLQGARLHTTTDPRAALVRAVAPGGLAFRSRLSLKCAVELLLRPPPLQLGPGTDGFLEYDVFDLDANTSAGSLTVTGIPPTGTLADHGTRQANWAVSDLPARFRLVGTPGNQPAGQRKYRDGKLTSNVQKLGSSNGFRIWHITKAGATVGYLYDRYPEQWWAVDPAYVDANDEMIRGRLNGLRFEEMSAAPQVDPSWYWRNDTL